MSRLAKIRAAVTVAAFMYVLQPLNAAAATLQICPANDPNNTCANFVKTYIQPVITLLTISIGIFGAISIVVAGIQYSSAGDDTGKVNKAKNRIFQTVIGLVAYFFLYSILNFLVPGGLF